MVSKTIFAIFALIKQCTRMAISKYFIKKGSDTAKDLYATYRLYILESKGLWDLPTRKEAYAEKWYDKNGQKVYEPVTPVYQPTEGSITFAALGDVETVKTNIRSFYSYITNVIPATPGTPYGSSSFSIWNDVWGESAKQVIRCTGFETGAKMSYQDVQDLQNPDRLVSAYTFSLNFSIDQPTL